LKMTVWQLAAELGKTEPLEKIWECVTFIIMVSIFIV